MFVAEHDRDVAVVSPLQCKDDALSERVLRICSCFDLRSAVRDEQKPEPQVRLRRWRQHAFSVPPVL
jgi:hypothetical protein